MQLRFSDDDVSGCHVESELETGKTCMS
jgi:hypothetical protein